MIFCDANEGRAWTACNEGDAIEPYDVSFESRSGSGTFDGYSTFINPENPPNYYLRASYSGGWSVEHYDYTWSPDMVVRRLREGYVPYRSASLVVGGSSWFDAKGTIHQNGVVNGIPLWTTDSGRGIYWGQEIVIPPAGPAYLLSGTFSEIVTPLQRRVRAAASEFEYSGYTLAVIGRHDYASGNKFFAIGYNKSNPEIVITLSEPNTIARELAKKGDLPEGNDSAAWYTTRSGRNFSGQSSVYAARFQRLCPGNYRAEVTFHRYPFDEPNKRDVIVETRQVRVPSDHRGDYVLRGEVPAVVGQVTRLARIALYPEESCDETGEEEIPGQWHYELGSVRLSIGLGRVDALVSAGRIYFHSDTLDEALAQPSSLSYIAPERGVTVIRGENGELRQILTPEVFVDVLKSDGGAGFLLNIYHTGEAVAAGNGNVEVDQPIEWDPDAQPFVSYAFRYDGDANSLLIEQHWEGSLRNLRYSIDPDTGDWIMDEGNGMRVTRRREESVENNRVRVLTTISGLVEGVLRVASKTEETYEEYTRNSVQLRRLLEKVEDPDGVARWERRYYCGENAGLAAGKLLQIERSDGTWVRYEYDPFDTELVIKIEGWGNNPSPDPEDDVSGFWEQNSAILYLRSELGDLDGDGMGESLECEEHWIEGKRVGREYLLRYSKLELENGWLLRRSDQIRSANPDASWNDPDVQVIRYSHYENGPWAGQLRWEMGPDSVGECTRQVVTASGGLVSYHYEGQLQTAVLSNNPLVEGTYWVRETDYRGRLIKESRYEKVAGSDYLRSETVVAETDSFGRATLLVFVDGSVVTREYACCGLKSETDRRGIRSDYLYDALGRMEVVMDYANTPFPKVQRHVFDAEDRIVKVYAGSSIGNLTLIREIGYNLAGEIVFEQSQWLDEDPGPSHQVSYSYGSEEDGSRWIREQRPDGGVIIRRYQRDGRISEIRGNAVINKRHRYGVEFHEGGFRKVESIHILDPDTGMETGEFVQIHYDGLCQLICMDRPSAAPDEGVVHVSVSYRENGRKIKMVDPDGPVFFYHSDVLGRSRTEALAAPGGDEIDYSGNDRIVRRERSIAVRQDGGASYTVERVVTKVWDEFGKDSPRVIQIRDVALQPSAVDGNLVERMWLEREGKLIRATLQHNPVEGVTIRTTQYPDGSALQESYVADLLIRRSLLNSSGQEMAVESFVYDEMRRLVGASGPIVGTDSTFSYYRDGRLRRVEYSSQDGDASLISDYSYQILPEGGWRRTVMQNESLLRVEVIGPDGNLHFTYGAGQFPVRYEYDPSGRLRRLTTWKDFEEGVPIGEGDTHEWVYNTAGLVVSEVYSGSFGPAYTYSPAGRLKSRTWARGVTTYWDYGLDKTDNPFPGVEVMEIHYSDETPSVSLSYDRMGRLIAVKDASGLQELEYEDGNIKSIRYMDGPWAGMALDLGQDNHGRSTGYTLFREAESLHEISYHYQSGSNRMDGIESRCGGDLLYWRYEYVPGASGLVSSICLLQNGDALWSRDWDYDPLGRLRRQRLTAEGQGVLADSTVHYNSMGLRSRISLADGSAWEFTYDDYGQLLSGLKRNEMGTPIPGYQFSYGYDAIGNRVHRANPSGETLAAEYGDTQQLRQMESIRKIALRGLVHSEATVKAWIHGGPEVEIQPHSGTFFATLNLEYLGNDPRVVEVNVEGRLQGGGVDDKDRTAEDNITVFIKENPEKFYYDEDGNLTGDGEWVYEWDAENRLIAMESSLPSITAGRSRERMEYSYDSMGRRILSKHFRWNAEQMEWEWESTVKFLYLGWHLLREERLSKTMETAEVYQYVWGMDLSEMRGASLSVSTNAPDSISGGSGGLLAIYLPDGRTVLPQYDENGNIVAYYDAFSKECVAHYEYGPFGELLMAVGVESSNLKFRFSTKYTDPSSLIYYGYRYYDPMTGRWINRDPIGERGGVNLYSFVNNNPISLWDSLGLYQEDGHFYTTYILLYYNGYKKEDAFEIAYYSQLPDEDKKMEAMNAGAKRGFLYWLYHNPLVWPFHHIIQENIGEQRDIIKWLHSLHGGGEERVAARRACLEKLLANNLGNLSNWEKGLIIHALGDAYAHTYVSNEKTEAYGDVWGHIFDVHEPDIIANHPDKYLEYLASLNRIFGGKVSDENLARIGRIMSKRHLRQGSAIEMARNWAHELEYDFDYDPSDGYRMIKTISRASLKGLIKKMKDACCE